MPEISDNDRPITFEKLKESFEAANNCLKSIVDGPGSVGAVEILHNLIQIQANHQVVLLYLIQETLISRANSLTDPKVIEQLTALFTINPKRGDN